MDIDERPQEFSDNKSVPFLNSFIVFTNAWGGCINIIKSRWS